MVEGFKVGGVDDLGTSKNQLLESLVYIDTTSIHGVCTMCDFKYVVVLGDLGCDGALQVGQM